jgi:cell division protein FtsL
MKGAMFGWMKGESGKAESKVPAVIAIILIVVVGFLSYKFIPIKVRNMKLKQELQKVLNIDYAREYKTYSRGGFNEYTMREKVLKVAKKLNIPFKDVNKEVEVLWPEQKLFTVEINYVEEVSIPVYGIYPWEFHVYLEQELHAGRPTD